MSLISVAELMTDPFFVRAVVLRRPAVHFANEGEAITTYEPDVTVVASVQPADAKVVDSVPEGERGDGRIVEIYSATEFKMAGKDTIADLIVVPDPDGGTFKIVGSEEWGAHGYYRMIGAEILP